MHLSTKILLVFLALLLACHNKDDLDSFQDVDISDFNLQIEKGIRNQEQWAKTPYLIVNQLFGPQYNSEGYHTFILEQYENDSSLTIIVTQEGLLDDCVEGEKRIIEFKFSNGFWIISKMRLGIKCYEYRGGHTNYSGEGCS